MTANKSNAIPEQLQALNKSHWQGKAELWLDPLGNDAEVSHCTLEIKDNILNYTWHSQENAQKGTLTLHAEQMTWADSWHQPTQVTCRYHPQTRAIFSGEYSYPAPPGPDWGWRIELSQRPDSTLVLQMTNIAPWGEETRAVRMIFTQSE